MREIIKELLMKYCDPKPEISGVMASDIAERIEKAVLDALPSLGYMKSKNTFNPDWLDTPEKEKSVWLEILKEAVEAERNRCIGIVEKMRQESPEAIINGTGHNKLLDQALKEIKGEVKE